MTTGNATSLIDIMNNALALCSGLPPSCTAVSDVAACKKRLSDFTLRCGITGMAGRGVSSLVNTLVGYRCIPDNGKQAAAPAIICYGPSTRCTIRYQGKLAGTAVQGSCESIFDCLTDQLAVYAADKQIQDAVITCDTPLLFGGIELADIPGFSPHANNSSTLDFLTTCDCLLYVLSGSERPSNREAAFIMEAAQAVPAVFFLISRTDLLTVDDMKKADTDYSALLTTLLQKNAPIPIFHCSSKLGQELLGVPENNPAWQVSGIGALKSDIIETLAYEKYCKVAREVHDDLHAAVTALHNQLNDLLNGHGAPAQRIRTECAYLKQRALHIADARKKLKQSIDVCYSTITTGLDVFISSEQQPLHDACTNELRRYLKNIPSIDKTLPATVAATIAPRCAGFILEIYDRIMLDVHRQFRETYEQLSGEISALSTEIARTIPGAGIDIHSIIPTHPSFPDTSKHLDDGAGALCSVVLPSVGLFANKDMKRKRATACFCAILDGCINRNMVTLPVHIKEAARKACDKLYADSLKAYDILVQTTEHLAHDRLEQLKSVETSAQPQVTAIKKRISGFEAIAASL